MLQFLHSTFNNSLALILTPECAIGIYCGEENAAATIVSRFCSFNVFMNTPHSQIAPTSRLASVFFAS